MNCTINKLLCGENGICINNKCHCLPYWSGEECKTSYIDSLGIVYKIWNYSFIILFGVLLIFTIFNFILNLIIKQKSNLKNQKLKVISFSFIIIGTLFDPLGKRGFTKIIIELIGGWGLFFIFSSFILVFIYWIGLYHYKSIKYSNNSYAYKSISKFNPIARNCFIIFDSLWFCFELIIKILNSTSASNSNHHNKLSKYYYFDGRYQFLLFVTTVLSITFIVTVLSMLLFMKYGISNKTNYDTILVFGIEFFFEIVLSLEMIYILKDNKKLESNTNQKHQRQQPKNEIKRKKEIKIEKERTIESSMTGIAEDNYTNIEACAYATVTTDSNDTSNNTNTNINII
ncbi:hypothetical protein DDB_G0277095 [Dictyostelium discoideum AX4]|uniref:Uncharacterized protein n=1 Tax=Dictyostelium discoideum TaxID=44689 RepID=Q550I2_DICDI|nr:hypothetical protein DDB_G0277095 [Dictyostelium discoideum AX4]EAL69049.2 hypothetical protein DDB_G0277095 [Dictyostelium discoideum AX4]|eukprot:XP_642950.2 hypothetical protein DDB_G0277095 [Dictyostelium discoideum AX4]